MSQFQKPWLLQPENIKKTYDERECSWSIWQSLSDSSVECKCYWWSIVRDIDISCPTRPAGRCAIVVGAVSCLAWLWPYYQFILLVNFHLVRLHPIGFPISKFKWTLCLTSHPWAFSTVHTRLLHWASTAVALLFHIKPWFHWFYFPNTSSCFQLTVSEFSFFRCIFMLLAS